MKTYQIIPASLFCLFWLLSQQQILAQEVKGQVLPGQITPASAVFQGPIPENNPVDNDQKETSSKPLPALPAWQTIMSEDFEGAFPNSLWNPFAQGGSTDAYWDDSSTRPRTGSWSAWCADQGTEAGPPGGPYPNDMSAWMIYGPFDLSDATDATLDFFYWNISESNFDYFQWFASINGTNFFGDQTSGNSNGWQSVTFDLTNVFTLGDLTGQPQVWIAFRFGSDSSIGFEGAYVDDIILQKDVGGGGQTVTVLTPTRTGTRPPLVAGVPVAPAIDRNIPPHESKEDIFRRLGGTTPSGPGDAAVQAAPGALGAPTILTGFEGVGNLFGGLPPDSDGGIGINHYFEWINLSFAIYNRTGTLLFGPAPGNTMFAGFGGPCETTNDGDPVVLYDQLADRWFVSQFAVTTDPASTPESLCIAVSDGSDPLTSSWFLYEYDFVPVLPDYMKYGIWDDMYTLTFHGFTGPTFNFTGLRLGAFDRTAMLAGNATAALQFYNADVTLSGDFFGALPPRIQGPNAVPADTPAPFIHMASNEGFGGTDRYTLLELDVDFVTPANTTLTQTDLPADPFDQNLCSFARDCIPQPGTAVGLDSFGGNTLFQAPVRDMDPTAGIDLRLLAQGPVDVNGADLAGIRWIELQNTGGGWSVRQQSTFAPADGRHRWMGSIAMNGAGDIAMGYSVSDGTSTFPAIWATGRLAGDPLDSMTQGETVLRVGGGSQTSIANRWGDYSVTNVDPVDDHSFWHVNEYLTTTGSAPWATYISHFELSPAGPVTRYVATGGSDTSNTCVNPASPCATIAHAVSEANAGDTLNIEAGTYAEPASAITKALHFIAAGVIVE